MRMLFIIVLIILFGLSAKAQDCEAIKSFNSFRGIRLGHSMPDSIRRYFTMIPEKNDTMVFLGDYQTVDHPQLNKYITFKEKFQDVSLKRLNTGAVYSILLSKSADDADKQNIKNGNWPTFFKSIKNELTRLFGSASDSDGIKRDIGKTYALKWQCGNILIEFMIANAYDVIFYLSITDVTLQKRKDIENYK